MKRRASEKDKKLADGIRLLRARCGWHREQLEQALAGVHRDVMARLMGELKDLHSARKLVDFIAAQNWEAIDVDTRLIALHEINQAITKLREQQGLSPIDDALPGEQLRAYQVIRNIMNQFPAIAGRPAGTSGKSRSEE